MLFENRKQFLIIKYVFYIFCYEKQKIVLKNSFQTELKFFVHIR